MARSQRTAGGAPRLVPGRRNWKDIVLAIIRARIGADVRHFRRPEWAVVTLRRHQEHGVAVSGLPSPVTLGRRDLFEPSSFVEIFSATTTEALRVPSSEIEWVEQPSFMTLNLRIAVLGGIDQLRSELARCRNGARKKALVELIGEYDYERKQQMLRRRSAGLFSTKHEWRPVPGGRMESNRRRH